MPPRRPEPIDVSRSRSKSPGRIPSDILQPKRRSHSETKQLIEPLRKPETPQLTEPLRKPETSGFNPIHRISEKIREIKRLVVSANGALVEPKTPPGPPPYIKTKIKRPVIRRPIS